MKKERLRGVGPLEAPTSTYIGQELENDFLCYKIKCKETLGVPPPKLEVEDQFGTRFISGLRTHTVCAPARKRALLGYDAPRLQAVITEQTMILEQTYRVVELQLTTATDADFMLLSAITPIDHPAGYSLLSAITPIDHPAGYSLLSATEDVAARSCPAGAPVHGESGGDGCRQVWDLKFLIAPSRCYLDGSFTLAFDVGCNSAMPHYDLVDPAEPDAETSIRLSSPDFCGSE